MNFQQFCNSQEYVIDMGRVIGISDEETILLSLGEIYLMELIIVDQKLI